MPDLKKKRNILHLVILVLACLAGLAIADVACFDCNDYYIENQFIDATVFGYLIVAFLLLGALLFDEEIPEKTLYLLCAGGALLYLVSAICLLVYTFNTYYRRSDYYYISKRNKSIKYVDRDEEDYRYSKVRLLCGSVICLALGVIYLAELVISLVKKDLLE